MKLFFFLLLSSFLGIQVLGQTPVTFPVKPELVFVKGGTFAMGSKNGEEDEQPVHSVTLSDFSIGKYEVTVVQYRAFCEAVGRRMPQEPDWGWEDRLPIVHVSYNDAVAYCNWLSEKFGGNWRLPTEAEWEYAAKGGSQSRGYTYAGGNELEELGWYMYNSWDQPNPVGTKKPNELGIYDMSGNVSEWCADWYGDYSPNAATDPKGPSSGEGRVLRGGSWFYYENTSRITNRSYHAPTGSLIVSGFRVVLSK
jgi:formylglycine-generating enzyme